VAEPGRLDHEPSLPVGALPLVRYRSDLAECRDRLRDIAFHNGGAQVAAMVNEAKLLRATLVLASGSPLGASSAALVAPAVSIELLHLASLVHDDIIDGALERRGLPALHLAAGGDRALVVGDLLIVAAFDAMSQARMTVPSTVFARSVEALSKGAQLCCFGQLEELDPRTRMLCEDDYLDVVGKKTGALFSLAASLGALVAGAGDDELAALATLGTKLGIAYQIRDDLGDGAEDEPGHRRGARSGTADDVAPFSPTLATQARASDAVREALDRVPESCMDGLRVLTESILHIPRHIDTTPAAG
jgi:geranylgeranyl pyrophosphate synthase